MGPSKDRREEALDIRRQYRAEQVRLAEEAAKREEEAERRRQERQKGGKRK